MAVATIAVVVVMIVAGVTYIAVKVTKTTDPQDYAKLIVSTTEGDTVTLTQQILTNEKILVVYFHPECEFCRAELNGLQRVDMPDLTVDLVSYAPKDSVDELLKDMSFGNLAEINVICDTTFEWKKTIGMISIPTTLYFKDGRLARKRGGYFKLENILYEE